MAVQELAELIVERRLFAISKANDNGVFIVLKLNRFYWATHFLVGALSLTAKPLQRKSELG